MTTNLSSYTTIAVPSDEMERVRITLENLFGIQMHGVASGAWGDYFTTPNRPHPKISVFQNMKSDEDGQYWNEDDYQDYPLLISIDDERTPGLLNTIVSKILSEPGLEAVLVRKSFFDDEGNDFDERGNPIEEVK